jgi:transcriptional regulator with XRE-family HTH domain
MVVNSGTGEWAVAFGNEIERVRKGRGLTQVQLAEAVGVGQAQVARWEAGKYEVKLETVQGVCTGLGCAAAISVDEWGVRVKLVEPKAGAAYQRVVELLHGA